jgi:hypothetical protein
MREGGPAYVICCIGRGVAAGPARSWPRGSAAERLPEDRDHIARHVRQGIVLLQHLQPVLVGQMAEELCIELESFLVASSGATFRNRLSPTPRAS